MMDRNQTGQLRDLNDAELDDVSGGRCTCGIEGNCATYSHNSSGTVTATNCSGKLIYLGD